MRATDIGRWAYCRRAWWLAAQGHENRNRAELAAGTAAHERHGRRVAASLRLHRLAVTLFGLGLVLLLATLLIGRS
ncbi:MAG: hypothetical protein N2383_11085 [Caldilineales bacterium]|nr:hypothetical protein [Caldilineales bacterium]